MTEKFVYKVKEATVSSDLSNLSQGRREELFKVNQKYRKFYNFIKKSDGKLSPEQLRKVTFEREFLSNLLKKFIRVLGSISAKGKEFS